MKVQLTSVIVLLQLGVAVSSSVLERSEPFFSEEEDRRFSICHRGSLDTPKKSKPVPCNELHVVSDNCLKKDGWLHIEEPYHTPEDQQKCLCDSDYWELWKGCSSCYRLHGGREGVDYLRHEDLDSFSSAYCNNDPVTVEYYDFHSSHLSDSITTASTANSDVLGTQTAMSLYYTGEVSPMTTVAGSVATATATASTTTGAAPALRQDSGLLAPMGGLMVAVGMLA